MVDLEQVKVTPRDQQVFSLLVEGSSNKAIAGPLNISLRTVKQHLHRRPRNPGGPQAGETGYGHA